MQRDDVWRTCTVQGGYRLELLVYDSGGNHTMTYNLTSPADGYLGADDVT